MSTATQTLTRPWKSQTKSSLFGPTFACASTTACPPLKKRKSPEPPADPPEQKRARVPVPMPRPSKRADKQDAGSDLDPETLPEHIYRSSSSRATSSSPLPRKARTCVTNQTFDTTKDHLSSYSSMTPLMRTYKPFFHNPDDPDDYLWKPHPVSPPVVELEYPYNDAIEDFMLLEPKDKDHYNPIFDLETTVYTMIRHFMTPRQQRLFGTLPRTDFQFDDEDEDGSLLSPITHPSRETSKPLHIFRRAISTRDGPLFLEAVNRINELIRTIKYPKLPHDIFEPPQKNHFIQAISEWNQIPKPVILQILEENYQRSVGPHVSSLKQYEAFSSEVYGELMPSLVYQILERANLAEDSLFLDLGSGVGNLVVQASLQTGCRSYGIELQEPAARVAADMVKHFRTRCTMWGLKCGEIEVERGNMLESSRVDELIPKADLVLVDNKMFNQFLNESLKPKFLDLKEGAIVVSLKPFSAVNARVTERNLDDMSAIFEVEERSYRSGDVSWGDKAGSYFVHTVNRHSYADTRERFENQSRSRRSRSVR